MIPGSASIVSSTSHSLKFSPHAVCQNSPGNYPTSWSSWGQDPAAGPGHQATHRDYGEAAQVHNMRLQVTQAKRPQKVGSMNQILRLHILNSKWPPCYRKGSSFTYTEPECWLSQGNWHEVSPESHSLLMIPTEGLDVYRKKYLLRNRIRKYAVAFGRLVILGSPGPGDPQEQSQEREKLRVQRMHPVKVKYWMH